MIALICAEVFFFLKKEWDPHFFLLSYDLRRNCYCVSPFWIVPSTSDPLCSLSLSRDSDFPGYTHHHHADDLPSVMPTTPSAIAAPSFVSLTLEPSAPPLISFSFFWVLCSDMRPTAQPQQFHVTVNVVVTVIVVVESKVQSTTVCCACECVCMVGVASFFNTIPHFSRFLGNAFSFIFSDLHH